MNNKKSWLQNPDTLTKVLALALLLMLVGAIQIFGDDFFSKTSSQWQR